MPNILRQASGEQKRPSALNPSPRHRVMHEGWSARLPRPHATTTGEEVTRFPHAANSLFLRLAPSSRCPSNHSEYRGHERGEDTLLRMKTEGWELPLPHTAVAQRVVPALSHPQFSQVSDIPSSKRLSQVPSLYRPGVRGQRRVSQSLRPGPCGPVWRF